MEALTRRGHDQRHVHRRQVIGDPVVGDGASRPHLDAPRTSEPLDAGPFRTVAHQQQSGTIHEGERLHRLLERVEASEAAHPTHYEATVEPELVAQLRRAGSLVEEVKVDTRGCDEQALIGDAQASDLLGDWVRSTCDQIGLAQHPRLASMLDGSTPSGPAHPPLPRLPDERGRGEHDRPGPQRASKVDTRSVEHLVTLPDERHVTTRPRPVGGDAEASSLAPPERVPGCGLGESRDRADPPRREVTAKLLRRPRTAQVIRRHRASGRDDPRGPEHPTRSTGPTRGAQVRRHRAALTRSRTSEHEDRPFGGHSTGP